MLDPTTIEGQWQNCTPGVDCWNGTTGGTLPNWSGSTAYWGYGGGILKWTTAINTALQQAGIQVNGYTYKWRVKNKDTNANQGDGDDYMRISVSLYDEANKNVYYKQFNLDGTYDWTTFEGTEWLANPLAASGLSNIQIRAEGDDIGYWAGYYGPEFNVADSSVNLLYTVISDPCSETPIVDPTCPGFIGNFPDPVTPSYEETTTTSNTTIPETKITVVEETPTEATIIVTEAAPITAEVEPEKEQQNQTTTQQSNEQPEQQNNSEAVKFVLNNLLNSSNNGGTPQSATSAAADAAMPGSSKNVRFDPISQQLNGLNIGASAEEPKPISTSSTDSGNEESSTNTEVAGITGEQDTADQMATVPQSFNNYSNSLTDANFYPEVELYANQRVPEKARNLRIGLASQLLWDEMVDQQYNK